MYHEFWHCQTDGTEAKDEESLGEVHDESSCTQCCVDFAVRRDEKMPGAIDTELVSQGALSMETTTTRTTF